MSNFVHILLGKGMRRTERMHEAMRSVTGQAEFDELFRLLFHHERLLIIRAAEVIEKITLTNRGLLTAHKHQLMTLLRSAVQKELKWHLALLVSRPDLDDEERSEAASILRYWALNPNESTRVRLNALQGLYELTVRYPDVEASFRQVAAALAHEPVAALQTRAGKLEQKVSDQAK